MKHTHHQLAPNPDVTTICINPIQVTIIPFINPSIVAMLAYHA